MTGSVTIVEMGENAGSQDDVGPVVHTVDESARVLVNTTMEGHLFHSGTVTRSVVIDSNGYVAIHTVGDGTGQYPQMNEVVGKAVFKTIDERIKTLVAGGL